MIFMCILKNWFTSWCFHPAFHDIPNLNQNMRMEITICIDTDKSHTLKAPCNETISSCSVIVNFQRHPVTLLLSSSEKIPEKGSEVWRQVSALALLLPSMCRTLGKSLDTHSRISGCPPENSRHLTQPRHTKEHSNPLATHQSTALYLEEKNLLVFCIWFGEF